MTSLRFGSFLAPNLRHLYEAVADGVGNRVGLSVEYVDERSYESFYRDVNDVSFVCGLAYVERERFGSSTPVPVAAPIPSGDRYAQQPVYFSDVIVHRDSAFRSLEDLRGTVWAYNEPLSQSGYGITRHHLVTMGEVQGFFGRVVQSGSHAESIAMVRRGDVDGTAVDSHMLGVELEEDPRLREELRVVEVLGPSTIQPITVSRRLSIELREAILAALTELHFDPRLQPMFRRGMIDRFVRVDGDAYDDIRQMVAACEAAGFAQLR